MLINPTQDVAPLNCPDVSNMSHFLDMTADKDAPQLPPLKEVVKQLINKANKHGSFTALFKLQAVKAYLKLHVLHFYLLHLLFSTYMPTFPIYSLLLLPLCFFFYCIIMYSN